MEPEQAADEAARVPPAARSASWLREHPKVGAGQRGADLKREDSGVVPARLLRRATGSSLDSLQETDAAGGAEGSAPSRASGGDEASGESALASPFLFSKQSGPARPEEGGGGAAARLHRDTPVPGEAPPGGPGFRASPRLVNALPSMSEAEYEAAVHGQQAQAGPAGAEGPGVPGPGPISPTTSLHRLTPMPLLSGLSGGALSTRASRGAGALPSLAEAEADPGREDTPNPAEGPAPGPWEPPTEQRLKSAPVLRRLTPMPDASPAASFKSQRGTSLPSVSEAGSDKARCTCTVHVARLHHILHRLCAGGMLRPSLVPLGARSYMASATLHSGLNVNAC